MRGSISGAMPIAGVAHPHHAPRPSPARRASQMRPPRGVYLMALVQEVADHLLEPHRVAVDDDRLGRRRRARGRCLRAGRDVPRARQAALDHVAQVDRARRCRMILPRGHPRDVEQVVDQPRQVADLALDDLAAGAPPRSSCGRLRRAAAAALRMAASGLRSSWPSMARNSSLRAVAPRSRRSSAGSRTSYWPRRARAGPPHGADQRARRTGRSSSVTLPSGASALGDAAAPTSAPPRGRRRSAAGPTRRLVAEHRASSARAAPAAAPPRRGSRRPRPPRSPAHSSSRSGAERRVDARRCASSCAARTASRPVGASTSTRCSRGAARQSGSPIACDSLDRGSTPVNTGTPVSTPWNSRQRLADAQIPPRADARTRGWSVSCAPVRFFTTEIALRTRPPPRSSAAA